MDSCKGRAIRLAKEPLFPAPPGPQHGWEQPRTVGGRLANRSRMLKAVGNAVVPAQVYPLFAAIMEAEMEG